MKNFEKIIYGLFVTVLVFVWLYVGNVFAALPHNTINVNTLSMIPDVYTWKYYCDLNFSVRANYNWGSGFTNCQYVLLYNPLHETISYVSRWSSFSATDTNMSSWNLWFWEEKNNTVIQNTAICSTLKLNTISTDMTGTLIRFVDKDWIPPTNSTFNNTDDLLNLSYNWTDTLTWVTDLQIAYEYCPCNIDGQSPTFTQFSHNFSSTSHYTWLQTIKFLVYDKWWSNRSYWTHGQKNFSDYDSVSVPSWMDNQEWINSWTIKVTLTSHDGTQVLTNWNGLTITRYTWTLANTPEYTWDGNDRWYRVTFTWNFDVETPVSISIEADDNALSNGSVCQTSVHKWTYSATINQKVAPTITLKTPINNAQNINPDSPIVVEVSDSWAGVNTGSVKITIPAIYSGSELLMTGYTYSWSDLSFELISWTSELWGASKYNVTFQPKYKFPTSTWISVTGYVEDLVWMTGVLNKSFNTRADCSFYGCVNYVDIFFWDFALENLQIAEFTWSLIVITWSIAPYPYLTWENNDIVMCGPVDQTIILSWNVEIYSGTQIINGDEYLYSWLFVTWLDFVYDPESGVITPIY